MRVKYLPRAVSLWWPGSRCEWLDDVFPSVIFIRGDSRAAGNAAPAFFEFCVEYCDEIGRGVARLLESRGGLLQFW